MPHQSRPRTPVRSEPGPDTSPTARYTLKLRTPRRGRRPGSTLAHATRAAATIPATPARPGRDADKFRGHLTPPRPVDYFRLGKDPARRGPPAPRGCARHRFRDPFRPGCRRCPIPVTGLRPYSCRDCYRDGAGHQCRGGARTVPLPGTSRGALGGIRTPGLQIHTDLRAIVRPRRTRLDLRIGASTAGSHTQCYAPSRGQIRQRGPAAIASLIR